MVWVVYAERHRAVVYHCTVLVDERSDTVFSNRVILELLVLSVPVVLLVQEVSLDFLVLLAPLALQ